MASKIHFGGLLGGQAEKKMFLKASRTPQRPFWEAIWEAKSFQTRPRSVYKTRVTSNSVLERFWNTLETDFKAFFEVSA